MSTKGRSARRPVGSRTTTNGAYRFVSHPVPNNRGKRKGTSPVFRFLLVAQVVLAVCLIGFQLGWW